MGSHTANLRAPEKGCHEISSHDQVVTKYLNHVLFFVLAMFIVSVVLWVVTR